MRQRWTLEENNDLTWETVLEARILMDSGLSIEKVAEIFDSSPAMMEEIRLNRRWTVWPKDRD